MAHQAPTITLRDSPAFGTVLRALLLGLVVMAIAIASTTPHSDIPDNAPMVHVSHVTAPQQHDCATSSGSGSGHCQPPAAVVTHEDVGIASPARSVATRWMLGGWEVRVQHRPGEPLRPPTAMFAFV